MKFRKKPVVIEAVQWNGDNIGEISRFVQKKLFCNLAEELRIKTLEGVMTASKGDWIIKGVKGEICPCKPDIFEQTYEPVEYPMTMTMSKDAEAELKRIAKKYLTFPIQGVDEYDKGYAHACRDCHRELMDFIDSAGVSDET